VWQISPEQCFQDAVFTLVYPDIEGIKLSSASKLDAGTVGSRLQYPYGPSTSCVMYLDPYAMLAEFITLLSYCKVPEAPCQLLELGKSVRVATVYVYTERDGRKGPPAENKAKRNCTNKAKRNCTNTPLSKATVYTHG
jgi:hypothetical protein